MKQKIQNDIFKGIILCAAIGDAMGMPYQFIHPKVISASLPPPNGTYHKAPEGHVNFTYEKGQYTDETQLMTLVIQSIIEKSKVDGNDIALRMVQLFDDNRWITPGRSIIAACKHLKKGSHWHEAGG